MPGVRLGVWIAMVASLGVSVVQAVNGGQLDLTDAQRAEAIALGRTCQAPIVRISAGDHDFVVYVEHLARQEA
jgi:hypothetical protein